jgi:hypothetical protein
MTGVQSSQSQNSLDNGGSGATGGGMLGSGSVIRRVGEGGGGEGVPLQSAVLFPSPENPLLDLLSDPPEIQNLTLASIHSEALSMPTSSYCAGKEGTSEAGSVDPGKAEILCMLDMIHVLLSPHMYKVYIRIKVSGFQCSFI